MPDGQLLARVAEQELVVIRPTVEGDPILTYYRASPGVDGIEVMSDNTADRFRGEDFDYQVCTSIDATQLTTGCRDA
ncbi:hypothetical protein [Cellulomonas edaphi]|uniref:Uncharacterized protein n=1 Tax=Cellulomonas edaphi TaxID=3053468 RepID=A0ABT7S938_9CELL|nr:hypothetical protein [Cellulomons edaphi]MDM7832101.1 hypothetical protein [Cellulomons edaphi]